MTFLFWSSEKSMTQSYTTVVESFGSCRDENHSVDEKFWRTSGLRGASSNAAESGKDRVYAGLIAAAGVFDRGSQDERPAHYLQSDDLVRFLHRLSNGGQQPLSSIHASPADKRKRKHLTGRRVVCCVAKSLILTNG